MFSKVHQGIVSKTVVIEFENGYSITLEAGVEMCMHLVMDEAQVLSRRTQRAADEPQACDNFKKARDGKCYNCGCEEAAHR